MNRLAPCLLASCLLLAATAARAGAPEPAAFGSWPEFYRAFTGWPLDSTKIARVGSFMLERDAGTIVLEDGRLAFARPLGGARCAAQFVGRGTFNFTPSSEIERQQLRRYFGATTLRRSFRTLTLVFSDSTRQELESALTFGTDTLGQLRRPWAEAFRYMTVRNHRGVRPIILAQTLLEGDPNGLLWAMLGGNKGEKPLFFMLDPGHRERVQLRRSPDADHYGMVRLYNSEIVSHFFAAGDPDTVRQDVSPAYSARSYAIDVTVRPNLQLDVRAEVEVEAFGRPRRWLAFWLADKLSIDSLTAAGRALTYFQEKENDLVWVRCEPPLEPGERRRLRFAYHGEILSRDQDWVYHEGTTNWYPEPWYQSDATWNVAFHYPDDIQLVASGEKVEDRVEARVHHSRWLTRQATPWASFDVNFLRGVDVVADSLPRLTVWTRHLDDAGRVRRATESELAATKDYDSRVAHDLLRCVRFYQGAFGPAGVPAMNAVETPLNVYEGYPGLIHMMLPEDKTVPGAEWTPDAIRAHETAHQWWGLGVVPATYHDMWLSEGFSNFCSIWYLQSVRKDTKSYFDVLESWRTKLLENRKFLLGDGKQAGPIWLGPRTNGSDTPNDYDLVIYAKGAWVLHMLRNYLLDDAHPDEGRFRALLRDFYAEYRGRKAFTEDFRTAVERAAGEDMGWFFEQWVYGTDVPTYRFRWEAEPAAGGQWKVHGHVEQSNVPAAFRAPVFVRVDFGNGRFSRQRVWVTGPATDFELGPAPMKPVGVVFNDLQSVLCDVVK